MTRLALIALIVVAVSADSHGQQPVFRSSTELVFVPVLVKVKNRPLAGLTAADFDLRDNGVEQSVSSTLIELLPVDVTLVLDTSGSVQSHLAELKAQIQQMADRLQLNDRVRLLAVANHVSDIFGLQPAGIALPLDRLSGGGGTSFYNALAAALMSVPETDRPQLIFAFSDGLDNGSFLDAGRVATLAARANALLYIGLVDSPASMRRVSVTMYEGGPNRRGLRDAAARTGGAVVETGASGGGLSDAFGKVLDEFRTSYLLTYSPRGVARGGWHELAVKIKRPGAFEIRARKGYEGG